MSCLLMTTGSCLSLAAGSTRSSASRRSLANSSVSRPRRRQSGRTLREQFRFDDYLAKRDEDRSYTLSDHLKETGGEIGE